MATPAKAPSAEDAARFRRDLERLTGGMPDRIGLAVSGGPDSLALLLLASAAFPDRVAVATVDHALRPGSADEAALVADICATLKVPHQILTLRWDAVPNGNVQARAREGRYAALGRWAVQDGIAWVATAHHLDDQAETLLMRLARGAGLAGLAGVRPIGPFGSPGQAVRRVRPLLGWRKAELERIVAAAGLSPVDDPSNRDPRFDRSHARALLANTDWLTSDRLAASAAHLSECEDALSWTTARLLPERLGGEVPDLTLQVADLPHELQRRLTNEVFRIMTGDTPPGPEFARLLDTLRAGRTATLAEIKCTGDPVEWRFTPAPPRRPSA